MWSNTAEFTELILWRHVNTIYRNVSENLQFDHHVNMLYKIQSNVFRRYFNLDYCLCNFAPRYQGQKKDLEFDIEQSSDRVLQ